MADLHSVVSETIRASSEILEQRIRAAMALAGVAVDDLESGRARGEYRVHVDCECRGAGVRTRISGMTITVELCPCLEVVITKPVDPMGGDRFVHV